MPYISMACRLLLFTVLALSAWSKIRNRTVLAELTASFSAIALVRLGGGRPAAFALVAAEAVAALALAMPWIPAAVAFGFAAVLLCALTGGVAVVLGRRLNVVCQCFGRSRTPLRPRHLVRNLGLLATAVLGLAATGSGMGHPAGLVVAGFVGALVAVLVISIDDIAELLLPFPTTTGQKGP